jgi:hypothetical protein
MPFYFLIFFITLRQQISENVEIFFSGFSFGDLFFSAGGLPFELNVVSNAE